MAGYSGTPLAAKLGIKPGVELHVINAPDGYRELLAPLPDGVRFTSNLTKDVSIVHVFSARRTELERLLRKCRQRLEPNAVVWVSWPKKTSKVPTDITEDTIREIALPLGFVDIKVCAVSEVWSGLKLMVRKELR